MLDLIKTREIFGLPNKTQKNSLRPLVYKRMAITNILENNEDEITIDFLKKLFFVTRTAIYHYRKKHEEYLNYKDYQKIYNFQLRTYNNCINKPTEMKRGEEKLQIACYSYFHNTYPDYRGLLCYNLNNPRNEIDGRNAKLMGLQKGRPDFELNYNAKTYFAELKLPDTSPTEQQLNYHALLSKQGFPTELIRSLPEFKNWLESILPMPERPERDNPGW